MFGSREREIEPPRLNVPTGVREAQRTRSATIDFELTAAIRRIFLAPASGVRSVLFCTAPGDQPSDVAAETARLLSAQSGQRVAFVEYAHGDHGKNRTHIPDLYTSFSFVIVNATASPDELVSLACEVDGVIIVITKEQTRVDAALAFVALLRQSRANLLGTIFAT